MYYIMHNDTWIYLILEKQERYETIIFGSRMKKIEI